MERKIVDYVLLSESDRKIRNLVDYGGKYKINEDAVNDAFEAICFQVNNLIKKGYQPFGMPSIQKDSDCSDYCIVSQAMVKYED